jgi:hypothetical protein
MAPSALEASGQLPIRIVSRHLVKASSDPSIHPHTAAASNIDIYNDTGRFSVVCLYPNEFPKAASFDDVVATFLAGLPSLLNHFYPLCGRIATDASSGHPVLHCHNQGAELVVGEVHAALGSLDLGEAESLKKITLPFPNDVALSVQLLSFGCGHFAVVWGIDHLLADGFSITQLIRTWSELSRSGTTTTVAKPHHDRSLFRPRDRPSYGAKVAELLATFEERQLANVLTAHDSFVERLYYVQASDLDRLREMASTEGQRPSRVQALSAYLWKVLAGVVASSRVPEERCRMGWFVDVRPRLTAPEIAAVMPNYFGNAVAYTLGDATVEEIRQKPLADVAAMAREAIKSIDYDEYIQEIGDWVGSTRISRSLTLRSSGSAPRRLARRCSRRSRSTRTSASARLPSPCPFFTTPGSPPDSWPYPSVLRAETARGSSVRACGHALQRRSNPMSNASSSLSLRSILASFRVRLGNASAPCEITRCARIQIDMFRSSFSF